MSKIRLDFNSNREAGGSTCPALHCANIDSNKLKLVDKVPVIIAMPGWGPETPNYAITTLVNEWMAQVPLVSVLPAR